MPIKIGQKADVSLHAHKVSTWDTLASAVCKVRFI